ncbi:hypothetical protein L218DRAFT_908190 [Marasmius fiardii PR-910]|nr:hypothetical protein L218DRAFT_908190 [Marasmius fiardii PR-910]
MALRFLFLFLLFSSSSYSQIISTSTPVPPLQWLNLTPNLTGSSKPPPLKDAFISYNQNSRTVIIFGGISQSGFPSSETYLLNLDTLSWSKPAPPSNLQQAPSPRSALASVSGPDFAANSRSAFMLYGGTGSQQEILLDAWEFDFQFQFWSQVKVTPGGPAANSGIAGGLDSRNTNIQAINNTFYVVKSGSDSGLWRFNVSGTLASNIPDGVLGSWDRTPLANLPPFSNSASTVVGTKVVSVGGCTKAGNSSCAFIATNDAPGQPLLSNIPSCASSRTGARLVPNLSIASTGFSSQCFLLLGKLDPDWNDDNGLDRGEVAVLDINTGTWSRLIPSGDPSASNAVPGPREGAAISALPGEGGSHSSSDIIVFGGRDVSGNYLDEVWILRAYNGTISPSSPQWSGFGDGKLQGGYQAGGTGVTVEYLSQCATLNASPTSSGSSSNPTNTSTGNSGNGGGSDSPNRVFDTSIYHKVLSSVSIMLLLPAILLQRASVPRESQYTKRHMASTYACGFVSIIAYGLGIAGIATSFTTISSSSTSTIMKRSSPSSLILKTTHGQVGLAFFVILYGMVPVLYLLQRYTHLIPRSKTNVSEVKTSPRHSEDKSHVGSMSHNSSLLGSPRPRSQSFGPSTVYRPSNDRSDENDTISMASSGPQRTFEVVNRPKRRGTSGGNLTTMLHETPRAASRSLSDIDWLQRRRSLNAVGELDYAISQAIRAQEYPPTPATTDVLVASDPRDDYQLPIFPSTLEMITRIILQLSLCGLYVITLIALWSVPSSRVFFALFLSWIFISYSLFMIFAWRGLPPVSILSVVIARLRGKTTPPPIPLTPEQYSSSNANTPTPLATSPGYPFPASGLGPYIHHNPPHRTLGPDDFSYASPRSAETDFDDDADEDEDIRQQRIESEMGRREVSIVTVPKRKLWIANPS